MSYRVKVAAPCAQIRSGYHHGKSGADDNHKTKEEADKRFCKKAVHFLIIACPIFPRTPLGSP